MLDLSEVLIALVIFIATYVFLIGLALAFASNAGSVATETGTPRWPPLSAMTQRIRRFDSAPSRSSPASWSATFRSCSWPPTGSRRWPLLAQLAPVSTLAGNLMLVASVAT
jgi:hypothetical protein